MFFFYVCIMGKNITGKKERNMIPNRSIESRGKVQIETMFSLRQFVFYSRGTYDAQEILNLSVFPQFI